MLALSFRSSVLALLFVASACQPSTSSSGSDGPARDSTGSGSGSGSAIDASTIDALTATEACTQLATLRCEKLMTCSPADMQRRYGDVNTCEARELLACKDNLAAPDTGATPGSQLACGQGLSAATCPDFLAGPALPACRPAGPGAGTCAFEAQCSTTYCAVGANALCGVCQTLPVVGQSCAASGCGDTLICDGNTKKCVAPSQSGQACNKTQLCDRGLACVGAKPAQNINGACQPVITTVGAACDQTRKVRADCSGDDGLTCNTVTNLCVAQPYAPAGQPCGLINNVHTACTAGSSCVIPTGQTAGTCVAPAADGGACDTANGPNCFEPARCIPTTPPGTAGTCRLPGSQSC